MTESEKFGERMAKFGNEVLDFFGSDNFTEGVDGAATAITWGAGIGIGLVVITFIFAFIYVNKNQDKYP